MRTQFCESKDSWARRFRKTSANILLNPAGVDSARRRGLGRNAGGVLGLWIKNIGSVNI